jgi:RNA polymerase sigma factor (sigma-70 family)
VSEHPSSVPHWLARLKAGDHAAATKLWERYSGRLVTLARQRLRGSPRRAADEEDVALSAFDSFCRRAEAGCFPKLDDRDEVWNLLLTIVWRKADKLRHHEGRQKRGGGAVRGDSALPGAQDTTAPPGAMAAVADDEPTPEEAALCAEEFDRLLALLPDAGLRRIALLRFEGYANAEIAQQLRCVVSTVERRLKRIRALWQKELER